MTNHVKVFKNQFRAIILSNRNFNVFSKQKIFSTKVNSLRQGQYCSKNCLQSAQCQPVFFHLYAVCCSRQSFVRRLSHSKQEPSAILLHFVPPSSVEDIPGRKTQYRKADIGFIKKQRCFNCLMVMADYSSVGRQTGSLVGGMIQCKLKCSEKSLSQYHLVHDKSHVD